MTGAEALKLYEERDKLAKDEQSLEKTIFDVSKQWDDVTLNSMLTAYRRAKSRRANASVLAARAFMMLPPEERQILTDNWSRSSEGRRKAAGSGMQGTQPTDGTGDSKTDAASANEDLENAKEVDDVPTSA